ncbi:MAG: iron-containing redox enzyme family protein [Acidobacteria bacterium]|nr:iron-containing redox enzyme family protein [Acidobacteriota bacterium]
MTASLLHHLQGSPHTLTVPLLDDDPVVGHDTQLALWLCYELHYQGLEGVDDRWEWEPSLLAVRAELEGRFIEGLEPILPVSDPIAALWDLARPGSQPSLSRHLVERGTLAELREFAIHRSGYQLKEADPHTWAIPRLSGLAKAGMVHIQTDEYGNGDPTAMHSALFADTMTAIGLDASYGRYIDVLPGVTLATTNLISMFGLHRRFRAACVGHLALFEMTSPAPMARYAAVCDRLGLSARARRFYDVHVDADTEHSLIATTDMVRGLIREEPDLGSEVVWGARCLVDLEQRFTEHLLTSWARGQSSLFELDTRVIGDNTDVPCWMDVSRGADRSRS